ncbi:bifunctional adenosylcobinamide kinase/adenosylcobinamide-phosphate guanylyltransferase [Tindallia californiensis]|uniref:Adenosylcobinamide kinase n=1 Tax=Tindallia californiensis TaxID=159292 RepID=A0A1H3I9X3_9FIRM|nr:bifunctional adenosylcobinamide kinase/adenosylcobinamide-phosphate guanylyltransferase [Tindallia californiensis]SDY24487.1 adenosylcobinamide kinase /adenosylcobinamide-phosphate guanylyltransferase [Tindallia californiensis]
MDLNKPCISLVIGGTRSGKSKFGETLVSSYGKKILYVATSAVLDPEMSERVRRHKQDRPSDWITLETYRDFDQNLPPYGDKVEGIFVDCITLMITRLMMEKKDINWDDITQEELIKAEEDIHNEIDKLLISLKKIGKPSVLITNEVGCGIVPEHRMARDFRDIAGRINQKIAKDVMDVYWVVAGIPVKIKSSDSSTDSGKTIDVYGGV